MNSRTREEKRALLAKFKTPTDLPLQVSGIVAEVVPVPMAGWIEAGEVPEALFGAAASAVQSGPTATAEALKLPEMFGLSLKVARAAFKWPKCVDEGGEAYEGDPDTINPATLPLPDLAQALQWGMTGSLDTPVQLDGEEVTTGRALEQFHGAPGLQGNSGHGPDVRQESGA